jgi:hypothetical protein
MQGNPAFASGADLWIVPERKKSRQVQHLDWYLGFQIAKSVQHQPATLSDKVTSILDACALKNYDFAGPSGEELDALLILSSRTLPNRWVMVLKGSDNLEGWATEAIRKWKKMNSPTLRVFLPEGCKQSEMQKLWKRLGGPESAQLIEEAPHD